MEKLKFKIALESEWFNHPPNFRISLNKDTLIDCQMRDPLFLEREILLNDDELHTLDFTLHDKSKYDTKVNDQGEIVKDTVVKIKKIEIDDVDITHMLSLDQEKFYYETDSGEKGPFYNTIGINGTATVKFTTPFYQWLLETL